ncbi:MAG: tRNA lysidine(34) synthetase TilS [Methylococcaceae bacterium]
MSLNPLGVRHILERHPRPSRYWIAYSGGMDSHVLLHLCAQMAETSDVPFTVAHVHHGLQSAADDWAAHCQNTCERYALPCHIIRVNARAAPGASPEEAARMARYQALQALLAPGDILLTAQHQNDQAETLLLQLFRGSGLAGLAAMPEYAPLSPGFIVRPLLEYTRGELHAYAHSEQLQWVEDPSNQDQTFDRNFLRQAVWPVLESRWPGLASTLSRTAAHCAEAHHTLDELAERWLSQAQASPNTTTLDVEQLSRHTRTEQTLVLRAWLKRNGLRMISARLIRQIQTTVMHAGTDRNPRLVWADAEIRRYRNTLYLIAPPLKPLTPIQTPWDGLTPLILPDDNGRLDITPAIGAGIAAEHWQTARIHVGYRQGGESIRLPARHVSHELKKFLQEQGIPPWIRERLPLIYLNGQLASIAGRWTLEPYNAAVGASSVQLDWIY